MTGLGALERVLPTGIPGPPDAIRTLRPVACKGQTIGSSDRTPLTVFSAVFASGMIGIYQVDLSIPDNVPDGPWHLHCGDSLRDAIGFLFTKPR